MCFPAFSAVCVTGPVNRPAAGHGLKKRPSPSGRLKRVAADHRDDIRERLPQKPTNTNGKRIALIGAGPASFTVANDLAPMGYECTIFEKLDKPGGLMRSNIPAFRLPEDVLMDELGYILDMGVALKLGTPVNSMKELLNEGYDAVFVGTGAPKGKDLRLPGAKTPPTSISALNGWKASPLSTSTRSAKMC